MTVRMLVRVAAAAAVLSLAGLGALSSERVRSYIKRSPLLMRLNSGRLRRLDSALYNARHPVKAPAELGDGGPLSHIALSDPMGLARNAEGTLYLADRGLPGPGHVVWAVSGGIARIVAGTGRRGVPQPGIPAREADLGSPQSIAADREGRVYIADSYNHMVVRVDLDGRLALVAGNGQPGHEGDGGPATEARLNQPYDVRVDAEGNVFIADYGNHRIRRVAPDGIIHTVAGTGEPGYTGDGLAATAARLHGPYGVYPHPRYGLLIADSENHVIRAVDREGTIRTLAGTGQPGNTGDGGAASLAQFNSPQSFAADAQGNLFVGDEHNHEIRLIDTTGIVHRVLGTGQMGFSADGTPSDSVRLNDPESMVVLPDGTILFTEAGNHRLRALDPSRRLRTMAGDES